MEMHKLRPTAIADISLQTSRIIVVKKL